MTRKKPLVLLVVTAHPADAFDLSSGTLARHSERGDRVHVVAVTHGARSHAPNIYQTKQQTLTKKSERALLEKVKKEKEKEFKAAATAVGVAETYFWNEDDEPFILTRTVVLRLAELYREVRPDILVTHHPTERNHHDHPIVGEASLRAVTTAGRWLEDSRREPHVIPTIYFYGTQGRQDATLWQGALRLPASHVVDITDVIEKKKAALACFGTQKYQGASYNTPEYINRRIEAVEGNWGLFNASRYAEEFIARQPHQLNSLPTVNGLDR